MECEWGDISFDTELVSPSTWIGPAEITVIPYRNRPQTSRSTILADVDSNFEVRPSSPGQNTMEFVSKEQSVLKIIAEKLFALYFHNVIVIMAKWRNLIALFNWFSEILKFVCKSLAWSGTRNFAIPLRDYRFTGVVIEFYRRFIATLDPCSSV